MAKGDQINAKPHFKEEGPTLPCEAEAGDLYVLSPLGKGEPDYLCRPSPVQMPADPARFVPGRAQVGANPSRPSGIFLAGARFSDQGRSAKIEPNRSPRRPH